MPEQRNSESALEKVMVVDGDLETLSQLKTELEKKYKVIEATDGNMAVDLYAEHTPKGIILEAYLEKRSGFLVLEKIKKGKNKTDPPYVIFHTRAESKRHQIWAESLGCSRYVRKTEDPKRSIITAVNALDQAMES